MTITARRAKTRDKLIAAAVHVFAERGVAAASIEELTEAAGMTRGAFYSNFESKDELVLALIEWVTSQPIEQLTSNMEELTNPAEVPPPGATPAERIAHLASEAERVFRSDALSMMPQSRDWVITEREIELYTLRIPKLQAKYQELVDSQLNTLAEIIEPVLAAHGARTTIESKELVKILAAVAKNQQFSTVQSAGPSDEECVPDPAPIIQVLTAFVAFD